jgi:tetratricopeptide (TPR) repeat protein
MPFEDAVCGRSRLQPDRLCGASMSTEYEQSQSFLQALNDGARLLSQNRPGEALQKLLPLHKAAPANAEVTINVGGAYILQRKWNRATQVLRAAVALNPDHAMLWVNLGAAELGVLETSGPAQQERAIEAFERALQIDPFTANVDYHLGLIYMHRGELNRAGAFFQRALEVRPDDRDARHWLDQIPALAAEQEKARSGSEETDGASAKSRDGSGAPGLTPAQARETEEMDSSTGDEPAF